MGCRAKARVHAVQRSLQACLMRSTYYQNLSLVLKFSIREITVTLANLELEERIVISDPAGFWEALM